MEDPTELVTVTALYGTQALRLRTFFSLAAPELSCADVRSRVFNPGQHRVVASGSSSETASTSISI